jgi:hypothetical protein
MLSLYSNYDSTELINGVPRGGLNGYNEFRAQPQQFPNGSAGLLVNVKSDVECKLIIQFTNIIQEPYEFELSYPIGSPGDINPTGIYTFQQPIRAKYFRIICRNVTANKQTLLFLFTYIFYLLIF